MNEGDLSKLSFDCNDKSLHFRLGWIYNRLIILPFIWYSQEWRPISMTSRWNVEYAPWFLLCCSRKRSFLIKTVHTPPWQSRTHTQRREERGSHNYRLAHPVTLTSTTWRFITAWVDSPSFRVEFLLTSKLGQDCDSWNIMQTIILRRPRGLEKFHCHNPLFLQMLGHYSRNCPASRNYKL